MEQVDCQGKSDEELVAAALEDPEYFTCIVRRFEEPLTRYIYRLSGLASEDREDVLQDTFLSIYRNLNGFDQQLKFSSWIYRITHNITISYFRRQRKKNAVTIGISDFDRLSKNLTDENQEERLVNKEKLNLVSAIISRLPDNYRVAFIFRFVEGISYQEISDILKKPPGTIASLLHRAQRIFMEEAERQGLLEHPKVSGGDK